MKFSDFFELEDLVCQYQLRKLGDSRPLLSIVVSVMFKKSSSTMFFEIQPPKRLHTLRWTPEKGSSAVKTRISNRRYYHKINRTTFRRLYFVSLLWHIQIRLLSSTYMSVARA